MTTPTRRRLASLIVLLLAVAGTGHAAPETAGSADRVREALGAARDAKRGATLLVDGASIAMLVTAIDERHVSGRNQQFERIVVRLDAIDAVQL